MSSTAWERLWYAVVALLAIGVLGVAGTCIGFWIASPNKIVACRVEALSTTNSVHGIEYKITGIVPWHNDQNIAYFDTSKEAYEQMQILCPVKVYQ